MRKLVLLLLIAGIVAPAFSTELAPYLPAMVPLPLEGLTSERAYGLGIIAGSIVLVLSWVLLRPQKASERVPREPPRGLSPEETRDRVLAALEDCKASLRNDLSALDGNLFASNEAWADLVDETAAEFRLIEHHISKAEYDQAYVLLLKVEYDLWPWDDDLSAETNETIADLKEKLRPLVREFTPPAPPAPAEKAEAESAAA